MTDVGIRIEEFGDGCAREDCTQPLPWDMPAVAINQTHVYCSPDCAASDIQGANPPTVEYETVTMHDPQDHADRPKEVDGKSVDFGREVVDKDDALYVLAYCNEMMNGTFRPD